MKSIVLILLGLLLTIAFVSAQDSDAVRGGQDDRPYHCPKDCGDKICHVDGGNCNCYHDDDCKDVRLVVKVIGTWVDGSCGIAYTQYEGTIINYSRKNIDNIFISYKYLRLRSPSDIWNVIRFPYGLLSLPSYQQTINAKASYTFGFILEGTQNPGLKIAYVKYV